MLVGYALLKGKSQAFAVGRTENDLHCKKWVALFPYPAEISPAKLSLMGNNVRESFVSDLTAGDGKIAKPFLHCQIVGYGLLKGMSHAFANKISSGALQKSDHGICILG